MWKLIVGFVVFAAVALIVLKKAGGDIDLSGEKHGVDASHAAEPASAAATAASSVAAPASAVEPASGASR